MVLLVSCLSCSSALQNIPPKCRLFFELRDITTQMSAFFILSAVRASDPTHLEYLYSLLKEGFYLATILSKVITNDR
jgi:hypothetical protein